MPATILLQPRNICPEMQDGLQARTHDPLWFLARQWQFGEFIGDDAGSPAGAQVVIKTAPISRYRPGPFPLDPASAAAGARDYSPASLPLETLVEREPAVRPNSFRLAAEAGQHCLRLLAARGFQKYQLVFRTAHPVQAPPDQESLDEATRRYLEILAGRGMDGVLLYAKLLTLQPAGNLPNLFNDPPFQSIVPDDRQKVIEILSEWMAWFEAWFSQSTEVASWVHERLEYAFAISGQTSQGEVVLKAPEYLEGHLDWFSFVADPTTTLGATDAVSSTQSNFLPSPVNFRGMPASRFWEFEDARVNFGKVEAAPGDLARLLLVEFGLIYGNDWFVVPVEITAGSLCRIDSLIVTNTFGERVLIAHASEVDKADSSWRMFALAADTSSIDPANHPEAVTKLQGLFFLPPSVGSILESSPVEEVVLLRDEMANCAWAVERVVESASNRPLDRYELFQAKRATQEATSPEPQNPPANDASPLVYRGGTDVPDYWIPLLPVKAGAAIRLRRGSLPRLDGDGSQGTLEPQGVLLDPGRELVLRDEEVPREGALVTRSFQYVRWIDGSTHLWMGRRKGPGRGEGSSGLRFDVV